jgi:hypothetical protein
MSKREPWNKQMSHSMKQNGERTARNGVDLHRLVIDEGRKAYEEDLKARPFYHDGKPRKTWEQLNKLEQSTWSK